MIYIYTHNVEAPCADSFSHVVCWNAMSPFTPLTMRFGHWWPIATRRRVGSGFLEGLLVVFDNRSGTGHVKKRFLSLSGCYKSQG